MSDASNELLLEILKETRTIACVGLSPNPVRPSHYVAKYLARRGYRVIPINPGHAGKTLLGETVYADLTSIPCGLQIDMVDIFRSSEHVPAIVDMALRSLPDLKTVWMQLGVTHAQARQKAQAAGLNVIENKCPKIEYQRLFGELRQAGINTRIITAKL